MNKKNTECLFSDFPQLYRGRTETITTNLMSFGFCCGDGWFLLIYELSAKVTEYAEKTGFDAKVSQVKEKCGGLRFYLKLEDEIITSLVEEAEERSFTICEKCGEPGLTQRNKLNWLATLCQKCQIKNNLTAPLNMSD